MVQVQSGWCFQYCTACENETYCPEEFEEFYKQRRRWIASTLVNIISLIKEWSLASVSASSSSLSSSSSSLSKYHVHCSRQVPRTL
ncbi:chitin synthase chs-1-like isoform X4 [Crassostrea virginica]